MIHMPQLPASSSSTNGPSLRDIHLPPQPSWWPPAPGWWALAVLALLMLVLLAWAWRRRRHASGRHQRVLAEVDRLAQAHHRDHDATALATGLHHLLRRVARQHVPSSARQTGPAWRQTLARVPVDAATVDRLLQLDEWMYRSNASFDADAAVDDVRAWLGLALKPRVWKLQDTESADA